MLQNRDALLDQKDNNLLAKQKGLQEKEAKIAEFYMLSDEDKEDVMKNIDTYSLDDIEAKLSVIYVRSKVNFDLDENNGPKDPATYNLEDNLEDDPNTPAWVKAALETAKNLN